MVEKGSESEIKESTSQQPGKGDGLAKGLFIKISSFCWIDWALIGAIFLLIALIWYVLSSQSSFIVQVATPSLTIVVALLIMLKSARFTNVSTERHIQAIQDSTRIQIDSAMTGFGQIADRLGDVVSRLDRISLTMQLTATETSKIRQVEEERSRHDHEVEERERMAVLPKMYATLVLTGWLLWKNYQVKIETEDNDADDAIVRFSSFGPQTQSMVTNSQSFNKLTRQTPVFVNCGSASAIDRIANGVTLEITLRDLRRSRYRGGIEIPLSQRDRRFDLRIDLLQ